MLLWCITNALPTAITEVAKHKYTKNLAPLEFSVSKKDDSSLNRTFLVVNVFNLQIDIKIQWEYYTHSAYNIMQINTINPGINTKPSNGTAVPLSSGHKNAPTIIQYPIAN